MSKPGPGSFDDTLDHLKELAELWRVAPNTNRKDMIERVIKTELRELLVIMERGLDSLMQAD